MEECQNEPFYLFNIIYSTVNLLPSEVSGLSEVRLPSSLFKHESFLSLWNFSSTLNLDKALLRDALEEGLGGTSFKCTQTFISVYT